jgi:hypothetical protein
MLGLTIANCLVYSFLLELLLLHEMGQRSNAVDCIVSIDVQCGIRAAATTI